MNTENAIKRPLPTVGVDKYTFFNIVSDSKDTTEYGVAQALPGTVEITPTDAGGTATFDADNGAYENVNYVEKIGHEITNADIPPEVDALWRGLELVNGGVELNDNLKTPYFGVAWRVTKSDGSHRYFRCYKGSYSFASNTGGKTKPSSGAPDFQTAKATYTAVKRESDGKYYFYIDEKNIPEGTDVATFEEKWFTDMDYVPGVTEPVAE